MQNIHPLVVHFPVALLTVATLAAIASAIIRWGWIPPFARACLYLGTLGAAGAATTGFFAAQTVARVQAADHALGEHQTFAYVVLGLASALTAWSVIAWRRTSQQPRPTALWAFGNAALLTLLVLAANEGGELVHKYGVGTKLTGPQGPLFEPGHMQKGGAAAGASGVRDSVPTARDFR